MTLQDTIRALPDDEFRDLKAWIVTTETDRRAAQPVVEQAQADIVTELQDAGKLEKPDVATEEQAKEDAAQVPEWQDPGTDHSKMYHYGDVVRFEGKLVRSTHQGLNSWEPGTLGFDGRIWEIIDTPETEPETSETEETPETEETSETGETSTSETYSGDVPSHKEWAVNLTVRTGEEYSHDGHLWRAKLDHTTHEGWMPSAATYAVWEDLGPLA